MQTYNNKEIVKFYNRNEIKDHNFLIFELLIIEVCNLHCSYCYMRNESPTWESIYRKEKITAIIEKLSSLNKPVSICLSGGEATLSPHFMYFVKLITTHIKNPNSAIKNLHINTNFRLSKEKIKEIQSINPNVTFHISYHSSDETPQDEFIEKLLLLPSEHRELNIMLHPKKSELKKTENFIQKCIEAGINFYVKPVYINGKYKPQKHALEIIEKYSQYTTKEYIIESKEDKTPMNDWDLYQNNLIPLDTFGYNCKYTFFTIDGNGYIKQMCKLFDINNIFDDFQFFLDYNIKDGIICPFKNSCLWASSLDHLKEKI